MPLRTILAATVGVFAIGASAHATTFALAGSLGATPTFAVTANGITATFTSPAGNGFAVQSTSGLFSFSPALVDNNFFASDNLTITFSKPVTDRIVIPFAIEDAFGSGDSLAVTTSTGRSLTFAAASNGLPLQEPEGVIDFIPSAGLTSLTLSSPVAFAIGNVQVPEPMSLALLGTGLAGLAALRRRR